MVGGRELALYLAPGRDEHRAMIRQGSKAYTHVHWPIARPLNKLLVSSLPCVGCEGVASVPYAGQFYSPLKVYSTTPPQPVRLLFRSA